MRTSLFCELAPRLAWGWPVPRGTMPMGGSRQISLCRMASSTPSTQPTVPSPPQTSTRNWGTCWNVWRLSRAENVRTFYLTPQNRKKQRVRLQKTVHGATSRGGWGTGVTSSQSLRALTISPDSNQEEPLGHPQLSEKFPFPHNVCVFLNVKNNIKRLRSFSAVIPVGTPGELKVIWTEKMSFSTDSGKTREQWLNFHFGVNFSFKEMSSVICCQHGWRTMKQMESRDSVLWLDDSTVTSPSQRASVGDVEDLVRVEEFPEAVEQLSALQAAALRVDEHQQRIDTFAQLVVLRDNNKHDWGETRSQRRTTSEPGGPVVPRSPGWRATSAPCCWLPCL